MKKKCIWHGASLCFRSNLCDVYKGQKRSRREGRHKPKHRGESGVEGGASAAQGRARAGGRWLRFGQRGGIRLVMVARQRGAGKQRGWSAWNTSLTPLPPKQPPLPSTHSGGGGDGRHHSAKPNAAPEPDVSRRDTGRAWSRKWMYSSGGAWLFG